MKNILILVLLIGISFSLSAQTKTSTVYSNLDTLKYYNVNIRSERINNSYNYWANNTPVDKDTYDKYSATWDNLNLCRPCYLMTYNKNDKLINEGFQYTDCRIGIWIEYYPTGEVKLIAHYKENDTGNWDRLGARSYCSKKDGSWIYYDIYGRIIKSEKYINGKLIK